MNTKNIHDCKNNHYYKQTKNKQTNDYFLLPANLLLTELNFP